MRIRLHGSEQTYGVRYLATAWHTPAFWRPVGIELQALKAAVTCHTPIDATNSKAR